MDSLTGGQIDLSKLSDSQKQDLQQFVVNESQKAGIQQSKSCKLLDIAHTTIVALDADSWCGGFLDNLLTIMTAVHSLTDTCFRKCITTKISSGKLDRTEEPCMQNCVDRFLDANRLVVQSLERMRTTM